MGPVIEVTDLHKSYGDLHAVHDVSFEVQPGEVFALLGPNGAGKSTTIEILEGHRAKTSGSVKVLGFDPATAGREFRDRIGIVLQASGIEEELTVREAVGLYGSSYRNPRNAAEVVEMVGLSEKAEDRISTLSGGQQRRIDLALGLIGNPDVLFLDEPTTGFDPVARREAWGLLDSLRDLGTAFLLTTHYMEEAEYLADRVGVIVGGRIVATGTPTELAAATKSTEITFSASQVPSLPSLLGSIRARGEQFALSTTDATHDLHLLTSWALETNTELVNLNARRPTLEDVYISLTQPASESQEA